MQLQAISVKSRNAEVRAAVSGSYRRFYTSRDVMVAKIARYRSTVSINPANIPGRENGYATLVVRFGYVALDSATYSATRWSRSVSVRPSNGQAFSTFVPAVSATPEYKWSCRYYSQRRTRYCSRVTCGRASQAELDSQWEAETRGNLPTLSPSSARPLSIEASGNV